MNRRRVLIETLWNVKKEIFKGIGKGALVLIETLWNVKYDEGDMWVTSTTVLIETLWNVKASIWHTFWQQYTY